MNIRSPLIDSLRRRVRWWLLEPHLALPSGQRLQLLRRWPQNLSNLSNTQQVQYLYQSTHGYGWVQPLEQVPQPEQRSRPLLWHLVAVLLVLGQSGGDVSGGRMCWAHHQPNHPDQPGYFVVPRQLLSVRELLWPPQTLQQSIQLFQVQRQILLQQLQRSRRSGRICPWNVSRGHSSLRDLCPGQEGHAGMWWAQRSHLASVCTTSEPVPVLHDQLLQWTANTNESVQVLLHKVILGWHGQQGVAVEEMRRSVTGTNRATVFHCEEAGIGADQSRLYRGL